MKFRCKLVSKLECEYWQEERVWPAPAESGLYGQILMCCRTVGDLLAKKSSAGIPATPEVYFCWVLHWSNPSAIMHSCFCLLICECNCLLRQFCCLTGVAWSSVFWKSLVNQPMSSQDKRPSPPQPEVVKPSSQAVWRLWRKTDVKTWAQPTSRSGTNAKSTFVPDEFTLQPISPSSAIK